MRRFVRVEVLFTETEYQKLRYDAAIFTASGTVAAAVRDKLRLSPRPYGYSAEHVVVSEQDWVTENEGKS